jgi:hypothetical protein
MVPLEVRGDDRGSLVVVSVDEERPYSRRRVISLRLDSNVVDDE